MVKHKHGGNIFDAARVLGVDSNQIIDFSSNINPLGLSQKVKNALTRALDSVTLYPEPKYVELKIALSGYYSCKENRIFCGNGATEIIHIFPEAFNIEKALVFAPAFSEYAAALAKRGAAIEYALFDTKTFNFDFKDAAVKIERADAVFLCNPNNPSSTLMDNAKLKALVKIAKGSDTLFIIDESFMDFTEDPETHSFVSKINDFENLVVLKSHTKFFALPGLRIGSAVANEGIIRRLEDYIWPWNINNLAAAACAAAVKDTDFIIETRKRIKEWRMQLTKGLSALGISFIKPQANFILFEVPPKLRLDHILMSDGLLIRDCSNIYGLRQGYYRVAVKTEEQNRRLLNTLREAMRHV